MKRGFVLIFVMFICLSTSIMMLALWREASLKYDLLLERERYYKNFYLAELGLHYGVSNKIQYDKKLKLDEVEYVLEISPAGNRMISVLKEGGCERFCLSAEVEGDIIKNVVVGRC